jgi:hypothetical protein
VEEALVNATMPAALADPMGFLLTAPLSGIVRPVSFPAACTRPPATGASASGSSVYRGLPWSLGERAQTRFFDRKAKALIPSVEPIHGSREVLAYDHRFDDELHSLSQGDAADG